MINYQASFSRTSKVFFCAHVTLYFSYSYGKRGAAVVSVYIYLFISWCENNDKSEMLSSLLELARMPDLNKIHQQNSPWNILPRSWFVDSPDCVFTACFKVDLKPSPSHFPEDRWVLKIEQLWSLTETKWLWRLIIAIQTFPWCITPQFSKKDVW